MASKEIGESSNNTQGGNSSSCAIQVGRGLMVNRDEIPDLSPAMIFRVPRPLEDSNDHFYTPKLVSIGPLHHGKPELSGMENYKSEAVRRMHKRIQNKAPNVTITSIVEVEYIVENDKSIREFYGENIFYSPEDLAWMIMRDACFLFEFIISYIKDNANGRHVYQEMRVSTSKNDPIFDTCFQNPVRERIMGDILLFENQIPLFILQRLIQKIQMDSEDAANDKLDIIMVALLERTTRHKVFLWYFGSHFSTCCCHVLEVVYHGMVGNLPSYRNEAKKLFPPPYKCVPVCFNNGIHWVKAKFDTVFARCCKLCSNFMMRLHIACPTSSQAEEEIDVFFLKLPSAVELYNAGVKLHPVLVRDTRERTAAMEWIRFDEKTSTLYLPEVRVTTQSESLWRSVITMEVSTPSGYWPRPITQFAKLMDELVDTEDDVAVLRKAGIIHNHLGSNEEAAQVFNSLTKEMVYSKNCRPIDDVRRALHRYTKRKYKILWSEFVSAYFSKLWLVAGSVAASTLLLLMTVVQVFCLYYKCSS